MAAKQNPSIEVVQIPAHTFARMCKALIQVEKFLEEKSEWLGEESALRLLGCSARTLARLKDRGDVKYKAVGRSHQYERRSLERYNEKMSS